VASVIADIPRVRNGDNSQLCGKRKIKYSLWQSIFADKDRK